VLLSSAGKRPVEASHECFDHIADTRIQTGAEETNMHPPLYCIQGLPAGQVSIMARPRGGDWLLNDIKAIRSADVDVLVSLLTPDEVMELELRGSRVLSSPGSHLPLVSDPRSQDSSVFRKNLHLLGAVTQTGDSRKACRAALPSRTGQSCSHGSQCVGAQRFFPRSGV